MSRAAEDLAPFEGAAQRRRADRFGMFVFLASEAMLFGGLFVALGYYRIAHPGAAAQAAAKLHLWLGAANTGLLLTASLFVALAADAAKAGRRGGVVVGFILAALLGLAFLGIKATEYRLEYLDGLMPGIGPPSPLGMRPATLFISLYFVSTILHAIHVTVGIVLLVGTAVAVRARKLALPAKRTTVDLVGLYWHLVDVIWIFLFPLLYLARP